jgi:hypothetical protein
LIDRIIESEGACEGYTKLCKVRSIVAVAQTPSRGGKFALEGVGRVGTGVNLEMPRKLQQPL